MLDRSTRRCAARDRGDSRNARVAHVIDDVGDTRDDLVGRLKVQARTYRSSCAISTRAAVPDPWQQAWFPCVRTATTESYFE